MSDLLFSQLRQRLAHGMRKGQSVTLSGILPILELPVECVALSDAKNGKQLFSCMWAGIELPLLTAVIKRGTTTLRDLLVKDTAPLFDVSPVLVRSDIPSLLEPHANLLQTDLTVSRELLSLASVTARFKFIDYPYVEPLPYTVIYCDDRGSIGVLSLSATSVLAFIVTPVSKRLVTIRGSSLDTLVDQYIADFSKLERELVKFSSTVWVFDECNEVWRLHDARSLV